MRLSSGPQGARSIAQNGLRAVRNADVLPKSYILIVIAAIIFTVRGACPLSRPCFSGLAVLGYIAKGAFAPLPSPLQLGRSGRGDHFAAGIALPFVYQPLRYGIENSPLLKVGASALLGSRLPSDR